MKRIISALLVLCLLAMPMYANATPEESGTTYHVSSPQALSVALQKVVDGDTIVFDSTIYLENNSQYRNYRNITIRRNENNAVPFFRFSGEATLAGFTFEKDDFYTAQIVIATTGVATIERCNFHRSGIEYNYGTTQFVNCEFSDATGQALIIPVGNRSYIVNSTFSNNRNSWCQGAGIVNHGILDLDNVTITRNMAYTGGGIFNDGTMTIRNCSIFGNESIGEQGADIYNAGILRIDSDSGIETGYYNEETGEKIEPPFEITEALMLCYLTDEEAQERFAPPEPEPEESDESETNGEDENADNQDGDGNNEEAPSIGDTDNTSTDIPSDRDENSEQTSEESSDNQQESDAEGNGADSNTEGTGDNADSYNADDANQPDQGNLDSGEIDSQDSIPDNEQNSTDTSDDTEDNADNTGDQEPMRDEPDENTHDYSDTGETDMGDTSGETGEAEGEEAEPLPDDDNGTDGDTESETPDSSDTEDSEGEGNSETEETSDINPDDEAPQDSETYGEESDPENEEPLPSADDGAEDNTDIEKDGDAENGETESNAVDDDRGAIPADDEQAGESAEAEGSDQDDPAPPDTHDEENSSEPAETDEEPEDSTGEEAFTEEENTGTEAGEAQPEHADGAGDEESTSDSEESLSGQPEEDASIISPAEEETPSDITEEPSEQQLDGEEDNTAMESELTDSASEQAEEPEHTNVSETQENLSEVAEQSSDSDGESAAGFDEGHAEASQEDTEGGENRTNSNPIDSIRSGTVRPSDRHTDSQRITIDDVSAMAEHTANVITGQYVKLDCGDVQIDAARRVVLQGYGDGYLHEEDPLTRAQMSMVLYRLLTDKALHDYDRDNTVFSDVPENAWFYVPVRTMKNAGMVVGTSDTTFSPNTNVTWGQALTVLSRFVGRRTCNLRNISYTGWALPAIENAVARGWIADRASFDPDAQICRGDFAMIFNTVLEDMSAWK